MEAQSQLLLTSPSQAAGIGQEEVTYGHSGNITIGANAVVTVNKGIFTGDSSKKVTIKAGATVNNTKYTSDYIGDIKCN